MLAEKILLFGQYLLMVVWGYCYITGRGSVDQFTKCNRKLYIVHTTF